jgi:hypothetical protein
MDIDSLVEEEKECVRRFKAKAAELRNSGMSEERAFTEAIQRLPKTCERYQLCRLRLAQMGVPSQPLR